MSEAITRKLRSRRAWKYEEIMPLPNGDAEWVHNDEYFFTLKAAKARSLECPPGHGWYIERGVLTTWEEYVEGRYPWESYWDEQYEFAESTVIAAKADNYDELVKKIN